MQYWQQGLRRTALLLVCALIGLLFSACTISEQQINATVTRVAGDFFATQTAAPPPPVPTPIYLQANGSGDFPTLKDAVEHAPDGATLILSRGNYHLTAPLDVHKSLTLRGAGMDQTEIVSAAEGPVVRFSGAGSLVAEDITFRHNGGSMADVVEVLGGEIDLTRCRFTGAVGVEAEGGTGLRLSNETTGTVKDCIMEYNSNTGIWVGEQAQLVLEANHCADNGHSGIRYGEQAGGVARENICVRNGAHGIIVVGQAQPTLERNYCMENVETGIVYSGEAGGMAYKNECLWNEQNGITVSGQARPEVRENQCSYNGEFGIAYEETASGNCWWNECWENELVGIYITEATSPDVKDNDCRNNAEGNVVDERLW